MKNLRLWLSVAVAAVIVICVGVIVFGDKDDAGGAVVTPSTPVVVDPNLASYTLADVAKHATATDCWTAVEGKVYNVTPWITQHPGGQRAIIGMCGIDATAAFDGQHGGQRRPTSELASFVIGNLTK